MFSLLRRPGSFRRLWAMEVVSLLGDWLTYVAVSILALERGDGFLAVALVLIAHSLPTAVLAPISGWITDRFDRRRVLVLAALARGGLTMAMAAAAFAAPLWVVQLLLVLRVGLGAFTETALTAVLPHLVKREELGPANALMAATWSVMFAVGVALGGFVVELTGPVLAIGLDSLTFVLAGVIAAGLPALPVAEAETRPRVSRILAELGEVLRYAWRQRPMLGAVLGKTPPAIANGGAWVYLTARAPELGWLGTTALTLGLLQSLRAVGTGVGPLVWNRVNGGRASVGSLNASSWLVFCGTALFAFTDVGVVVAVGVLLWGMGSGANWVAATTRVQTLSPDPMRGRLSAAELVGHTTGQCIGALLGALVATYWGPRSVGDSSAWTGIALAISVWIAVQLLTRGGATRREPAHAAE